MSSLQDEHDGNFIQQRFLTTDVYHLEDDTTFVLDHGYEPPESVFERTADDDSNYYVAEDGVPTSDSFGNALSLQPPTLDVMDNEIQQQYEVAYTEATHEDECSQQQFEVVQENESASIIDDFSPGTVIFHGVEGKLMDEHGALLQFYDSDNHPVTYFENDLPEGVHFVPSENLVAPKIQYCDIYGNIVDSSNADPTNKQDYYLIDEFGNQMMFDSGHEGTYNGQVCISFISFLL